MTNELTPEYWEKLQNAIYTRWQLISMIEELGTSFEDIYNKHKAYYQETLSPSLSGMVEKLQRFKADLERYLKEEGCGFIIVEQDKRRKYNRFLLECMQTALDCEKRGLGKAGDIFDRLTNPEKANLATSPQGELAKTSTMEALQ
jgi:hypothetical protein